LNASWLLVAAVYALAVWLARRGGIDLPRRVALFFYLLVLVLFFEPLTRDVVNLPVDFLRTLPPWSYLTRDHTAWNGEMNDLALQIVPWAHQVRESWRSLEAPVWNHLSAAGYPLLANAQSAALSPLRLLALPLPLGQSFAAEAAMKILIALTFTFLFCRKRGYEELPSVAGAIAFAFSSFIIVWLHFPLATAAVYLPAALYMVDLIAERATFGRIVFAAFLWAAILFSGHPETAAHIFFVALLYVTWLVAVERRARWRLFLSLGAAMAVAALLAAPFLAPLAEVITKSKRYHELEGAPAPGWYFSDWPSFIATIQPRFYGDLPFEKPWGTAATAESITGFSGALGIAAWLAVAVLVIGRRRWRSPEFFFVLLTLLVFGALFDWPVFGDVFTTVFHLAANTRLRLVFCLMTAILTAAALDAATGERRAYLLGIFASACLLAWVLFSTQFPDAWDFDSAVIALLPSVLTLAIATAVPFAGRWRRAMFAIVTVAVIAELWAFGHDWMPNVRSALMYPKTPLLEKLIELRDRQPANEPFRIVGTGPALFPNVSAIFGLEDVRAHDPMAGGRYVGLLRVLTGYDPENYFATWADFKTRLLDFLNVKYVVSTRGADLGDRERFALIYDGRDGRIFENTSVLPRVYPVRNVVLEFRDTEFARRLMAHDDWGATALLEQLPVENDRMRTDLLAPRPLGAPEAAVKIVSATPRRLRVHVEAPRYSLVGTSIPWWPGWKARTAEHSLRPLRINGTFFGFVVPPGKHAVEIAYTPTTFRVGVWVAVATVLALIVIAIRRPRRHGPF
jgi:hypothetical protein